MSTPKAIETRYKGYRFRSRLEARWAVFFDTLGVQWEYEKEGYELPSGRYLPDFWLPQVGMWGEVKATGFTEEEWRKCWELAKATGHSVLMLAGSPAAEPYRAVEGNDLETWLGDANDVQEWLAEYVLTPDHLEEGRFYSSPEDRDCRGMSSKLDQAVDAALAARFEHGEEG